MTAAAAPLRIEMIPVDGILPSPSNPRKTFRAIEDLAENIKVHGIKVPLRVRPIAETENASAHFELVFGERRWRAARKAGIADVPAIVEAMGDAEALELMLVELAQTSDVHPVEEAEAYRELHEKHGLSVEEIAAKVGKSKRIIYERMQLCALAAAVREAALDGKLPASHAVLIARVPARFQEEALKAVLDGEHGGGLMTHEVARDFLVGRYTLALDQAPWDLKDEQLVPAAGSCTKCPKRTGNQPELFADVRTKDTCTDPACFAEKRRAFVGLTLAKAREQGKPVIATVAETKKALKSGAYVDLDKEQFIAGQGYTSYGKLLGAKTKKVEVALAPAPEGVKHLVRKEEIEKLLPKAKEAKREQPDWQKQERKRRDEEDRRSLVADALLGEAVKKAEAKGFGKAVWFILAETLLVRALDNDGADALVAGRLGRPPHATDRDADKNDLIRLASKMTQEQLQVFILEIVLRDDGIWPYRRGMPGPISGVVSALGIDQKRIAARVAAEAKAAGKPGHVPPEPGADPAPGPEVAPAKAAPKPAKPTAPCSIPGCGLPGTKAKDSPGLWCANHLRLLSAVERKSIAERGKRLLGAGAGAGVKAAQRVHPKSMKAPAKKKPAKKTSKAKAHKH